MDKTTTDLKIVRNTPRLFTWGRVIAIHDVGDFTIVEFSERPMHNTKPRPPEDDGVRFFGYINEKAMNETWFTLDQCLMGLMAKKYDGHSSRAAEYLQKMIGMTDTKGN